MTNNGFWRLSGNQLLAGYGRREFSPVEVLNELLERVEHLNPLLRAYLALNDVDARRAAAEAERAWRSPGEKPLLRRNQAYREQMTVWFRSYDFLLTPAVGTAPQHDEAQAGGRKGLAFPFLAPFNTAQNPAAVVPVSFHSNGLPLAIQIVGRRGDDLGVLRMSAAIEAARPWADRWPALAEGKTEPAL